MTEWQNDRSTECQTGQKQYAPPPIFDLGGLKTYKKTLKLSSSKTDFQEGHVYDVL